MPSGPDGTPTNKVIAYGYGVDVAEAAGKGGRLQGLATDVVLTGLLGEPIIKAGHFGSAVRVHAAASPNLFSRLDSPVPDRANPPSGVPTNTLYRIDVIAADRVGTTAHQNPDTDSSDQAPPQADTDPPPVSENNCAERALWRAARQTGNEAISVLEPGSIGPEGLGWRDLQAAAGGDLTPVSGTRKRSAHQMIADGLKYLRGKSTVLVVDEHHGPVDQHGVGSHAYAMYFDKATGKVMVDDPLRSDQPFEFDPDTAPDVKGTWGVFYGAEGELLRPLAAGSGAEDDSDLVRPGSPIGETDPAEPGDTIPGRPPVPDGPITDAENDLATAAVAALGENAEPQQLLHDDYTGDVAAQARAKAEDNADWWYNRIGAEQREAMIRVHPELVGNADGIPVEARDRANRLALERDLTSYRMRTPERLGAGQLVNSEFNRAEPDHLRNLIATRRRCSVRIVLPPRSIRLSPSRSCRCCPITHCSSAARVVRWCPSVTSTRRRRCPGMCPTAVPRCAIWVTSCSRPPATTRRRHTPIHIFPPPRSPGWAPKFRPTIYCLVRVGMLKRAATDWWGPRRFRRHQVRRRRPRPCRRQRGGCAAHQSSLRASIWFHHSWFRWCGRQAGRTGRQRHAHRDTRRWADQDRTGVRDR